MAGKMMDDIVRCSFCNKTQAQVRKLIAGPNGTLYLRRVHRHLLPRLLKRSWITNDGGAFDDINLLTAGRNQAFSGRLCDRAG